MANFCSDCKNLDTEKKKCDGIYKCSVVKKYIPANKDACEKFEKSYARNGFEKEKLYEMGKKASNKPDDTPIGFYIIALIAALLILLFTKVF